MAFMEEKMNVMLDNGAIMPTRAHEKDAGLDLYARETKTVPARGSEIFDTGVHMEIPEGYAGILLSKSGLNVHHGLTNRGLIDSGYTGSIIVKLDNNSDNDYIVEQGQKISQIIFVPILRPKLVLVVSSAYRKPDQYIDPYMFAENTEDIDNYVRKKTGLWLKGLPKLETNCLKKPNNELMYGKYKNGKNKTWEDSIARNSKERSKTFPGIAKAMAEQWGGICNGGVNKL